MIGREITDHTHDKNLNAPGLLCINKDRFRGDIACLVATKCFKVYSLPFEWSGRLYDWFYDRADNKACFRADSDPVIGRQQNLYRRFLKCFLPAFYRRFGIKGVLGPNYCYGQDYDWGAVTHEIGVPFTVLCRESLLACPFVREEILVKTRVVYKKFWGSSLIFQNEIQKDILEKAEFTNGCSSIIAGISRLDSLIKTPLFNAQTNAEPKKNNRLSFFSFGWSPGFIHANPALWAEPRKDFFYEFCRLSHVTVARFARSHPEIEVVIKPKWAGRWLSYIEELLASDNLSSSEIPNLHILAEADVHPLIHSSDAIIAYGSTTMLEAIIMGKPVIMPFFAEIAESRFRNNVMFGDRLSAFDLATSPNELLRLMDQRLHDSTIPQSMETERQLLVKTYCGPLDGQASERTAQFLLENIKHAPSMKAS